MPAAGEWFESASASSTPGSGTPGSGTPASNTSGSGKQASGTPAKSKAVESTSAASKQVGRKVVDNKQAGGTRAERAAPTPKQIGTSEAGDRGPGLTGLDPKRVEQIRQFAIELARRTAEPGVVMVCNPITEPSALPAKELLYDRCRWCDKDIYYDRMMPSPTDVQRVCIACFVLMAEAEKKGAN